MPEVRNFIDVIRQTVDQALPLGASTEITDSGVKDEMSETATAIAEIGSALFPDDISARRDFIGKVIGLELDITTPFLSSES